MRFFGGLAISAVLIAAAVAAVGTCGGGGGSGTGGTQDGVAERAAEPGEAAASARQANRPKRPRAGNGGAGSESMGAGPEAESQPEVELWAGRKAMIQGVVKWPDGTPVADALVTLGDLAEAGPATTSASDGTFGIDEFPFYSCVEAAVVRDGKVWTGSVDADGGPLDLEVTVRPPERGPGPRIVLVVGWDGGTVFGGHATILRRGGGGTRWERTDAIDIGGGRFVADTRRNDDDGHALYVVTDPRDAEGKALPYGPALVDAGDLHALVTEVRLPPGTSLAGRVVGPDGAPVERADVVLEPLADQFDEDHMPQWTEKRWTDEDGRFRFDGLPPGKGRLWIDPPSPLARVDDLSVTSGGDEVVVKLVGTVSATVTATDPEGRPLAGAEVACRDASKVVRVETGADGKAVLAGLHPVMTTDLEVTCAGRVRSGRDEWVASDTTVVLPRAFPIEGTVTDTAGRPLPEARLYAERRRPESPDGLVEIYIDGTFIVWDMAEGDVAELRLFDGMARVVASTVATAGTRGVRLVWDDPGKFGVAFERSVAEGTRPRCAVTLRAEGKELVSSGSHAAIVTFDAAGLPARVDVQVGPLGDGRWAVLRNVEPRGVLRVPDEAWGDHRLLRGTVTGPDGGPWSRASSVTVSDGAGFSTDARVRDDGTFRCPGVPTTALTLVVGAPSNSASRVRSIPAGERDTEIDIRLDE